MPKAKFTAFVLACCILAGCGADEEKSKRQHNVYTQPSAEALKQAAEEQKKLTAKLENADKILAFYNQAMNVMAHGLLADRLATNTHIYEATYNLGKRPKGPRHNSLKPPSGIFSKTDMETMTAALTQMDKALATMLGHYNKLEKYVADPSIKDDGKRGHELVRQIGGSYGEYLAARKSWLSVLKTAAANAEELILKDHPLKRQIIAAQGIMNQFQEIASLFASGDPPIANLEVCKENLQSYLAEGEKPPFAAEPALEREYRAFLKETRNYLLVFDRGLLEGFHGVQKRELNSATLACQSAYNKFVAEANK